MKSQARTDKAIAVRPAILATIAALAPDERPVKVVVELEEEEEEADGDAAVCDGAVVDTGCVVFEEVVDRIDDRVCGNADIAAGNYNSLIIKTPSSFFSRVKTATTYNHT
jgi:hypothetical protein